LIFHNISFLGRSYPIKVAGFESFTLLVLSQGTDAHHGNTDKLAQHENHSRSQEGDKACHCQGIVPAPDRET
jgi:hypothetical protein